MGRKESVVLGLRVRPGARRTAVGGDHGGALVVRVSAPAVDGRATEAALAAVAGALGVLRRDVSLVTGAASRDKVVAVRTADADAVHRRAAELRGSGGGDGR